MTRQKKSRKPGVGSSGTSKVEKTLLAEKEKRIRKKTGNKPGSRQQIANNKKAHSTDKAKKDPRLGSKKPIELGIKAPEKPNKPVKTKHAEPKVAAIRTLETTSLQQDLLSELAAIEADTWLLEIVEKQEQELPLNAQEVDHFNELMERHQEITEQLALDEDESIESEELSEEDLWQKFNDGDFEQEL